MSEKFRSTVKRRKVLMTVGGGLGAALAGCTGRGQNNSGSGGTQSGNGGSSSGNGESDEPQFQTDPDEIYGNPVRKTPEDSDEWVDPDTLNFAYVPTEDPQALEEAFQPVIERIESETGKDVEYFGGQTYASLVEAMRSGRLHIGGFGASALVFAVNLSGAQPFTAGADIETDSIGYFSMTITKPDSGIEKPDDLKGKSVGHADPGSTSGNLLPRAAWTRQLDIEPGKDYEVKYTGGHDQSVLAVHNDDLIAAHVSSGSGRRAMLAHDIEEEGIGVQSGSVENIENFDIICKSGQIPSTAFSNWYKLHPDVKESVRSAMVGYEFDGAMKEKFGPQYYKEIDYIEDYQTPRDILAFEGIEFTEDELSEL
jgi:phosphonate transport system substrate-binding protein